MMEEDVRIKNSSMLHQKCKESKYYTEDDRPYQSNLQCKACERNVHPQCSLLPEYQLCRNLLLGKYHSAYICWNCIDIPEKIKYINKSVLENMKDSYDQQLRKSADYKEEIQALKEIIEAKDKELKEIKSKVKEIGINSSVRMQKKRKINNGEKINMDLDKTQIGSNGTNDKEGGTPKTKELLESIEKSIDLKMESMKESFTRLVEEKINNTGKINKTYATALHGKLRNDNTGVISMDMEEKNDVLLEESDRKRRENNVIIHGKEELGEHNNDISFVKNLLSEIGINIETKHVNRIGKLQPSKKRPIKIVFENIKDKELVISNLRLLKGKKEFQGLSVRDDYTVAERNIAKDYTTKAKLRNEAEEDPKYEWKVRGSPRNGMKLKRFLKLTKMDKEDDGLPATLEKGTHTCNHTDKQ